VDAEPTRIEMLALDRDHPHVLELDCEAQTVTLQFNEPDLQLSLDGVPYRLRRAHSALGRRYVGPDAELWLQSESAKLQLAERRLACQVVASDSP
jgi:membrane-bound inhibitor of C-type lysozyme